MSLLSKIPLPLGVGDVVQGALNQVLPKEYQCLGALAAGLVDVATGNEIGALKHALDFAGEVKDLPQLHSPPPNRAEPNRQDHCWCYEPPPPPRGPIGGCSTEAPRHLTPSGWRGSPIPQLSTSQFRGVPPAPASSAGGPWPFGPTALGAAAQGPGGFLGLSDDDLMKAVSAGKVPKELTDSPSGMLALQARMNHITEMNQLMTSMMQALHQMNMAVIQNVRV